MYDRPDERSFAACSDRPATVSRSRPDRLSRRSTSARRADSWPQRRDQRGRVADTQFAHDSHSPGPSVRPDRLARPENCGCLWSAGVIQKRSGTLIGIPRRTRRATTARPTARIASARKRTYSAVTSAGAGRPPDLCDSYNRRRRHEPADSPQSASPPREERSASIAVARPRAYARPGSSTTATPVDLAAAIAQERAWRVACAIACEERRGGGASAPSRVPFSLFGTIGPCRCRPLAAGVVVAWSTSAARSRGRLFVPRPSLPSCGACCQLSLCRSRFPLRSPTQSWGQP